LEAAYRAFADNSPSGEESSLSESPSVDGDFVIALRLQEEENRSYYEGSTENTASSFGESPFQQFNEHGSDRANNEYKSPKLGPILGFRHLKADATGGSEEILHDDSIRVEDGRYIHWGKKSMHFISRFFINKDHQNCHFLI
jgi:hypothetical protein